VRLGGGDLRCNCGDIACIDVADTTVTRRSGEAVSLAIPRAIIRKFCMYALFLRSV